jgi:protein-S-isoprenylcysteine O-methyltransferase Ste14
MAITSRTTDQTPRIRWWHNSRGELFVLGQALLFGLLLWNPRTSGLLPAWSDGARETGRVAGGVLMSTGFGFALVGTGQLGRFLTPLITPRPGGELLERGAFRLVRHPIYSGLIQAAWGWGSWNGSWVLLDGALLLTLLFDRKARREEALLRQAFPGYAGYCRRVRRLIPFFY